MAIQTCGRKGCGDECVHTIYYILYIIFYILIIIIIIIYIRARLLEIQYQFKVVYAQMGHGEVQGTHFSYRADRLGNSFLRAEAKTGYHSKIKLVKKQ